MKHRILFIFSVWCVMLCMIAGVFLLVTSRKDSRESVTENRMLQGFPSLSPKNVLSGDAMDEYENFLKDSFFGREGVISFTERLTDAFSLIGEDEALIAKTLEMEKRLDSEVGSGEQLPDGALPGGAAPGADDVPAPMPTLGPPQGAQQDGGSGQGEQQDGDAGQAAQQGPTEDAEDVPEGGETVDAPFLITATRSYTWMDNTDGTITKVYTYTKDDCNTYAQTLRMIRSCLPENGRVMFTEVPLASVATRWLSQKSKYSGWGSSVETMLTDSLNGAEGISVYNTYDILEPYVDGDVPMFYVTDHHWSAEGAYIVASRMLEDQGLPVIPYEEYEYKSIQSAAKTEKGERDTFNVLYPLLPTRSLVVTRRTQNQELPLMNYDIATYRVYMNNTRKPWRRILSDAGTGRKALVLCDSFGNAFTPYLLPYYDEVHMADFRSGEYDFNQAGGTIAEQIKFYGINDVYIVTSLANGLRKQNSLVYLRYYLTGTK